jgi:hypothetical protein
MAKIPISIANGFYESRSLPWSAQRCINWYPSYAENEALSEAVIFGTPGIQSLTTVANNQSNRGVHVVAEIPYFVNGSTLYRLDRTVDPNSNESFSAVAVGGIGGAPPISILGSNFVSMDDNGTQLCIVAPGIAGYIYNRETDELVQITDPGFTANGKSERVVVLDGFFTHIAGKNIFHSEVNDGLSYNALDVGQAQADPDLIVSMINYKNQLFVLGRETIEVFANIGKFPFTYQRIPGYFVPLGCFAPFSVTKFDQAFAFLGGATNERPGVFWGAAQTFRRISTTPIEQKIQTASSEEIEKAFTWEYSESGAIFLGLVIGNFCFVYDSNASRLAQRSIWHERTSTITELTNNEFRWRVNAVAKAYDRILVADSQDGRIGSISLDVFDEYGAFIQRRLTTRPLASNDSLFVDEIELTTESGVTTVPDNVIQMRYSVDNKIFNNPIPALIGTTGQYTLRQYWRRLGRMERWVTFEWQYSGRDKSVLLKAEVTGDVAS